MTSTAALSALRTIGGDILLATDGQLRVRAPNGCLPEQVRAALRVHRDELLEIVAAEQRWKRVTMVIRAFCELNDRMTALGPWVVDELIAVQNLAKAVDAEARRFIGDDTDIDAFQTALSSWETALRRGSTERPDSGERGVEAAAQSPCDVPEVEQHEGAHDG